MKPNEDYEIGQEDLIAQLGLLILEGRKHLDVKSSINDCLDCENGLIHHRKEDFLSFWQSCDSLMYIEVWLYHQEQFNENKAMSGHSDYLLIEQWEIEIKLSRSSEHGFHCTEKMLIQAISSKLHFSQLSAWLSLTKGKFPRHIYFRLCQSKRKTALERFIRAPDFHQFPQVNISTTQELVVSIYSLPHSDLAMDYPVFAWALEDLPSEATPQRKHSETAPADFQEHLVLKDECSYKANQTKDSPASPSHVVRKLEFEYLSLEVGRTSKKKQSLENVNRSSFFETPKNVINKERSLCRSTEQEYCVKEQAGEYSVNENQNLIDKKKEINSWYEPCNQEMNNISSSKAHLDVFKSSKSGAENNSSDISPRDYFDYFKRGICERNEFNGSAKERVSCMSKQTRDQGVREMMQKSRKDDSFSCQKTHKNAFASGKTLECQKECLRKQCFENTSDSEILRTNLNSECCKQEISKKSLLTHNIAAESVTHAALNVDVSGCSQKENKSSTEVNDNLKCKEACSNDRKPDDILERQRSKSECSMEKASYNLKSNQTVPMKERKLKNQTPLDRQRSNSESLEDKCSDHMVKKSWSVSKYGNVLHRTKNEMGDILPQVRHVMDKEYEKTLNERLRKDCLSSEGSFPRKECNKKPENTRKLEDNVFSEQKCTTCIPSRNSRYHFRHASTGTLAVFHPSTGLPMSSSPAPFRKTSLKQTVDDICSPSCEPSSLSEQCGNLSKSAPTLTTQSLLVNFEESVLNDRLLPDGVVEGFTAELGASGSKKCLPHITVPVQAYFFKLSDDNAPSPYMGYISLDIPGLRKKGYHVPKKGTIQLTLFNPNQTVVKVFVVLYDFSDMPPNFQTFLRQKTTSIVKSDGLVDRIHDNLHYLIHLRFASSKSGRIYLHTDIRVIFARHPPDQGNLRTSTSGPTNPKYSPRHDVSGRILN